MKKPKKKKHHQQHPQPESTRAVAAVPASGGTKSMTAFTRSVASEPKVVLPEEAEPTTGRGGLPVLLIAAFSLMFYVGMAYVLGNSGEFNSMVYYPHDKVPVSTDDPAAMGAKVFSANCAICHQVSGEGNKALGFPPLAGSEWVLEQGPDRIIRIVLNGATGPIEVKGEPYSNTMLPWRDTMTDKQIAAVLTYIRSTWGNKAPKVKPERVAAARQDTQGRSTAWTADELKAVSPGN